MSKRDKRDKCVLCKEKPRESAVGLFCRRCGTAYDRWNANADGTQAALIEWVANGARYWERVRTRKSKQ